MMKDRQLRWKEKLEGMDGSRLVYKAGVQGDIVGRRLTKRTTKEKIE